MPSTSQYISVQIAWAMNFDDSKSTLKITIINKSLTSNRKENLTIVVWTGDNFENYILTWATLKRSAFSTWHFCNCCKILTGTPKEFTFVLYNNVVIKVIKSNMLMLLCLSLWSVCYKVFKRKKNHFFLHTKTSHSQDVIAMWSQVAINKLCQLHLVLSE